MERWRKRERNDGEKAAERKFGLLFDLDLDLDLLFFLLSSLIPPCRSPPPPHQLLLADKTSSRESHFDFIF